MEKAVGWARVDHCPAILMHGLILKHRKGSTNLSRTPAHHVVVSISQNVHRTSQPSQSKSPEAGAVTWWADAHLMTILTFPDM